MWGKLISFVKCTGSNNYCSNIILDIPVYNVHPNFEVCFQKKSFNVIPHYR